MNQPQTPAEDSVLRFRLSLSPQEAQLLHEALSERLDKTTSDYTAVLAAAARFVGGQDARKVAAGALSARLRQEAELLRRLKDLLP